MPEQALKELDFNKYQRWLRRCAGTDYGLVICDSRGTPVWARDGVKESQAAAAIVELVTRGFTWNSVGNGLQRHDLGADCALLYCPIDACSGARVGWLAVIVDPFAQPASPIDLDTLAEIFEDIAGAIRDEHRANHELNAMALELSERYEELHLVYDVDKQIKQHDKIEEVFQNLLQNCAEHLNADLAAFIYPSEKLALHAVNLSKPMHNKELVLVELRGDLFRFMFSSRQSVVMNEKRDPRRAYILTDMPYKLLACPVFNGIAVAAELVLINHDDKPDFSNSDRNLCEVLANQLSALVRMHGMFKEMSTFTEQMASALIEAVEAKDPYTRGHSERVHFLAMEIGRAMGLADTDLDNLFWGSLLHDVGKIGVPDAVLCKPGRLTADEYTFIMVHSERSYEILRHIDRLSGAVDGARHHHEKFDGSGYPHGLKGKNIPLHARIIAVADTYDSITSSRAYRAGRSHEAAMNEIASVSGSQLDPDVIAIFRQLSDAEPGWVADFGIKRDGTDG